MKCRMLLAMVIFPLVACTPTGTATAIPTEPSPTVTPPPTATATAITPPRPFPFSSPSTVPAGGTPTAQSPFQVVGPLLVDSTAGRLYAAGKVGDKARTLVLAASDGHLLATIDITGTLALDSVHGWLYVDRGAAGLTVLDAGSGAVHTTIQLPRPKYPWQVPPAPQADPLTGQVMAFRGNVVYVADPLTSQVLRTIPFDVPAAKDCRIPDGPLEISGSLYDSTRRIVYLDFLTYVCTPWFGLSLVSYDMGAATEIARSGVTLQSTFAAIPSDGSLYGIGWYRMGIGYRLAWKDGRPWFESSGWSNSGSGYQVDAARKRLYQGSAKRLSIFDPQTMALVAVASLPIEGDLAGYDPKTDQLYFLSNGQLRAWPVKDIPPATPTPLAASQPPTTSVRSLVVSPAWRQDKTLFGIWNSTALNPGGECWVFNQVGGPFRISSDGGQAWKQPLGGLPWNCYDVTTLAVSPDYARDRTLFANVIGYGIFKSTDGGQLWQPSSTALLSMGIGKLLISPGFAQDRTLFAVEDSSSNLYRSVDGGRTWQKLDGYLRPVALSPEFNQDHTLMGVVHIDSGQRAELRISRDRGERWERVGDVPGGGSPALLSMAPLFVKWRVVFAYGGDGALYRSSDGGVNWRVVLNVGKSSQVLTGLPQLEYALDSETDRSLFLVVVFMDQGVDPLAEQGMLYRSRDGGMAWEALELPGGISPRALAISPNFGQDGLLFVGTADGRVVTLQDATLKGQTNK